MRVGAWTALWLTMGIQAIASMAILTLPVMAPAIAQSLRISATLIGVYVSLVYCGAMSTSLIAGHLVSRYGAIRVSQVCLLLCGLGLALSAIPSIAAISLGGLFIGLGYGPITPASSHLLAKTTPHHRVALIFSIKQTGVPLGGLLAGAIVPGLVLAIGTQSALLSVGLATVLCAFLAQSLRDQLDTDRQVTHKLAFVSLTAPLQMLARQPDLRSLAAMSFAFSAVQMCLSTYLVIFLNSEFGYSLVTSGLALSVAQAGGVLGRIVWGFIADRWLGPRYMLAVLAAMMTVSTASIALLDGSVLLPLMLTLLAVFGASATGWNGVYLAAVARLAPPGEASIATGATLFVTYSGVVLGPMLFGLLASSLGTYRAGFLALSLPTAICCWVLFVWAKSARTGYVA